MYAPLKLGLGAVLLVLFNTAFLTPTQAQITGFGTGFSTNANSTAQSAGLPAISPDGNSLQLTDTNGGEATSAFFQTPQGVTGFVTTFVYQRGAFVEGDPNNPLGPADGVAFVLQNDTRGTAALGVAGGSLGYGTDTDPSSPPAITPSAAIELDIFGSSGTNYDTDGGTGTYNSTGPVDLNSMDPILVTLVYDESTLSETLTDQTTLASTGPITYTADIPSTVGSQSAFVGFTGGNAAGNAVQTISRFSFVSTPEPSPWVGLSVGILGLAALAGRIRRPRVTD